MKIITVESIKPGFIFVENGRTHIALSVVIDECLVSIRSLNFEIILNRGTLVLKLGECEI